MANQMSELKHYIASFIDPDNPEENEEECVVAASDLEAYEIAEETASDKCMKLNLLCKEVRR